MGMLSDILKTIKYGKASEINLNEVGELVGNLKNVDFKVEMLLYHCIASPGPEQNKAVELGFTPRGYQSHVMEMRSVSGEDILGYLPGNDGLMTVRLEHRSKSRGKNTQHHLWIEREESDPVFNPRWETYRISGTN